MKLIFTSLFVFLLLNANSQIHIKGTVKDVKGNPLIGVSLAIKDSYDGGITDSSGVYDFTTTEKGNVILTVTLLGYTPQEKPIIIAEQNITENIILKEEMNELTAVTVTAGTFEASDRKRAATVLSTLDVLTTGGANADITSAIKTLPGAQQVGEQEGLFVRGGAGYETKQYIDGTVVNNPFFTSVQDIASRGRFSPTLFKGTVFSAGGYSALYGQGLSGALILESIDIPERSEANFGIAPLFVNGGFQQVAKDKKSSFGANYNYTNLELYFKIIKQTPDYFKVPQFHNADANYRVKTKNGIIKYYTTFTYGNLGLRREDIDSTVLKDAFSVKNINWYNNLSWRENLGNGWKMNLALSFSTNRDDLTQQVQDANNVPQHFTTETWLEAKNFKIKSTQNLSQLRGVMEKRLKGLSALRFGGEYWAGYNYNAYNTYNKTIREHFKSLFAESDIYVTKDIAFKAGLRAEHSSVLDKINVAPRLSMAYKTGKNSQASLAYGLFYQNPEITQLIQTTDLNYTKAAHYIANYQYADADRTLRGEIFYKKYYDLVKTFPIVNNSGSGDAKGFELFYRDKKTIRNFDYWISYSYLDTEREFLNYPMLMKPTFAATHTANIVTKKFVTEWKTGFNFTYTFATGRPYYRLVNNTSTNTTEVADQGKTKVYNNVGFSLNYIPTLGKQTKTFVVLVASATNLLRSNQVFGYNYSYNGMNKQAVTPPAKSFYFIGAFFSFGVDRTQDAINNNL